MTHVVTENCIQCRYGDCVRVCPVVCFHEGPNFMVIDPEECVDCGTCVDVCEAKAIFPEDELPEEMGHYKDLNKQLCGLWPTAGKSVNPLPDADKWNGIADKSQYLDKESKSWM